LRNKNYISGKTDKESEISHTSYKSRPKSNNTQVLKKIFPVSLYKKHLSGVPLKGIIF
jgi:hypothetical protein